MKYLVFVLMISMSITQCVSRAFAQTTKARASVSSPSVKAKSTVTSKTMVNSETRVKSGQVSKALMSKLKAQAMREARAELAAELEAKERARLEALEELSATVDVEETETSDDVE